MESVNRTSNSGQALVSLAIVPLEAVFVGLGLGATSPRRLMDIPTVVSGVCDVYVVAEV